MPPPSIFRNCEWLLLRVTEGIFESGLDNAGVVVHEEEDERAAANKG